MTTKNHQSRWHSSNYVPPDRCDYLVTYFVPVTVRVENADDGAQAESIAWDMWNDEKVVEAGRAGLDHTSFYFYHGGRPRMGAPVIEAVPSEDEIAREQTHLTKLGLHIDSHGHITR